MKGFTFSKALVLTLLTLVSTYSHLFLDDRLTYGWASNYVGLRWNILNLSRKKKSCTEKKVRASKGDSFFKITGGVDRKMGKQEGGEKKIL